jgi:hypothetical protein
MLCTMQYRQASWPGSFLHFCLRDLHLSHDVSVLFRLSSGTLRDALAAAAEADAGAEAEAEAGAGGAGVGEVAAVVGAGIIMLAGGRGP